MRFKHVLVGLSLFALATPAMAQDVTFRPGTGDADQAIEAGNDDGATEIADQLTDPAMQDGVASAVETMTETMMQLPIGPFVEAIEKARPGTVNRRIPRDATVADIAGRDADALPEKLADGSRTAMHMAGNFAQAIAVMMPEFENMARQMEQSFKTAKAQARRARR